MNELLFVFDLDGTVTAREILPFLAERFLSQRDGSCGSMSQTVLHKGRDLPLLSEDMERPALHDSKEQASLHEGMEPSGSSGNMETMTAASVRGDIPFHISFPERVSMLSGVPVSAAAAAVREVPLVPELASFLRTHREHCLLVTGNLDVWISGLLEELGMEGRCFCSEAEAGDRLLGIRRLELKDRLSERIGQPFVFIGDGANDVPAAEGAELLLAFAGAGSIAPALLEKADRAFSDAAELVQFLNQLLNQDSA